VGEPVAFRWRRADEDGGQGALFSDEELVERHVGIGAYTGLEFLHVNAKRVINEVPAASRMPFRYTINAYRGCSHACVYCFARPTHEHLGLDMGADFERKLVVKVNAVEKVRAEVRAPRWRGEHIAMGTNTDPYQRAEGKYHLTRGIVGALAEARNPFSILTKSTLILRDLDLLVAAAARTDVRCSLSIGTLDEDVWRTTEPGTPHPRRRVEAVRRLNDAGVPTGVLVAPIIPGWSDRPEQLEEIAAACAQAGATSITPIPLHLRRGSKSTSSDSWPRRGPTCTATWRADTGGARTCPRGSSAPSRRASTPPFPPSASDGPGPTRSATPTPIAAGVCQGRRPTARCRRRSRLRSAMTRPASCPCSERSAP
jgi:DNA repair photolyase